MLSVFQHTLDWKRFLRPLVQSMLGHRTQMVWRSFWLMHQQGQPDIPDGAPVHSDLEVPQLRVEAKKKRAVLSGDPEEEPVACIEVGSRARKLHCVLPVHLASLHCILPATVATVAMPQGFLDSKRSCLEQDPGLPIVLEQVPDQQPVLAEPFRHRFLEQDPGLPAVLEPSS